MSVDSSPQPVDYHALFRALPDAFLLIGTDPDATILDNTDRHEALSLKKREDVIGKPFFDAWPPADQNEDAALRASHEHVRRTRTAHTMPVIRYDLQQGPEGEFVERYWQATHYPVLDEQGELLYIVQRPQDVTEQQQATQRQQAAEAELAEQRDLTSFVLDALPLIVWVALPDSTVTYLNRGWYAFTGQSPAAGPVMNSTELIHPDDLAQVVDCWKLAVEQGVDCQFEYRLRRADGQYRWLLGRTAPRRDAQGNTVQWVGCATDIHEQKHLVEELSRVAEEQAALIEQTYQVHRMAESQREAFYGLFMNMPVPICLLRGPEHRFEFANPSYQQLVGNRALLGLTVAEALPEVVEQGFIALLDRVYVTEESFHGREVKVDLAEGTYYLDFTYQIAYEGGHKTGINVFAIDVTERVRTQQALGRRDQEPPATT